MIKKLLFLLVFISFSICQANAQTTSDLSLDLSVDNTTPYVESNVIFTLTVTNSGPNLTTGVKVTNLLPGGYGYVSDDSGAYDISTGIWTVPNLLSGNIATINITVFINSTGNYNSNAEITASDNLDPDSIPANGVTTEDDYAEVLIVPIPVSDLSILKSVNDTNPTTGDVVTFTISVQNNGPSDVNGVAVEDVIPDGFGNITNINNGGVLTGNTITWTSLTVGNGSSALLEFDAVVLTTGTNTTTSYYNGAEIIASNNIDFDSEPTSSFGVDDGSDGLVDDDESIIDNIVINFLPEAFDDDVSVLENSINNSILILFDNGNGTDDFGRNGPSSNEIVITTPPISGTASVNNNGTPNDPTDDYVEYTPNFDFVGFDTFGYRIEDDQGLIGTTVGDYSFGTVVIEVLAGLVDSDNDGIDDVIDLDDDNDGIPDIDESGGLNPHADADADGIPAYLDDDDTNAGIGDINGIEAGFDTDNDVVPNHLDLDSDNDGIYDVVESGQLNGIDVVDTNNDGVIDGNPANFGANGLFNNIESDDTLAAVVTNPTFDSDNDSIPDANELDADNDGCNDVLEAGYTDADSNGFLGTGTIGAGLTIDLMGVVTSDVSGYTIPLDSNANAVFDFQEAGASPTISAQPFDQSIVINANVNFDVVGTASLYQWQESTDNGVSWFNIANGGANPSYSGTTTDNLTLSFVPISHNGYRYRVVLSSPDYMCGGTTISNSTLLTVSSDFDGDSIADTIDFDDDNDGIPDFLESEGSNPDEDADADGIPAYLDDNDSNPTVGNSDGLVETEFDVDGDGIANHFDVDADGDGIYDVIEAGHFGFDANNDGSIDGTSGDFGPNGLFDALETSPNSGLINYFIQNTDADSIPDSLDVDDDNDGINTVFENPDPNTNGDPADASDLDSDAIPDYLDVDDDGDGVHTVFESSNTDGDGNPNSGIIIDTNSNGISDFLDFDDDGDGVNTVFESSNTDGDGNPTTGIVMDTDGDSILDYLDIDDDGDGVNTEFESSNTDGDGNPNSGIIIDTNSDGISDFLDFDDDGDGVQTLFEGTNIDIDGNPNTGVTLNTDGDLAPNYLDIDDDNDGIKTLSEQTDDFDGDSIPNYLDLDSDNDGIPDNVEGQSTIGYIAPSNVDSNANGLDDAYEPGEITPINTDTVDTPDYLDIDSDNDGVFDNTEGHDFNADGQPDVFPTGSDIDADGLDDAYDGSLNDYNDPNGLAITSDPLTDLPNRDASLSNNESDYRDSDDDGDGILTFDEDANNDNDPTNDDSDADGTPDYLDNDVLSTHNYKPNLFYLYPNPVKDVVNIELNNNHNEIEVSIFTITGRKVYDEVYVKTDQININLSSLTKGIYFMKVISGNSFSYKKILLE